VLFQAGAMTMEIVKLRAAHTRTTQVPVAMPATDGADVVSRTGVFADVLQMEVPATVLAPVPTL
jgi:hypothetical protein